MADDASRKDSVEAALSGLSNSEPRIKFGCSKSLILLSEKNPELLYEKIDAVLELLASKKFWKRQHKLSGLRAAPSVRKRE